MRKPLAEVVAVDSVRLVVAAAAVVAVELYRCIRFH